GRIHGTRSTYSPTGEPETIEDWSNDRLNGLQIVFQNGEKVAEVPYVNGKRQGVEKRLRAGTDEVVQTITWSQDVRHGPSIVYVDESKITDWYFEGNKVSRAEFVEKRQ
ncbi:MAG: hypothetical protein JSR46_09850, partial [Verrucomicrobia bacterium]|nr:hypothetical protein [Verrucomicrobiota bacterium]